MLCPQIDISLHCIQKEEDHQLLRKHQWLRVNDLWLKTFANSHLDHLEVNKKIDLHQTPKHWRSV